MLLYNLEIEDFSLSKRYIFEQYKSYVHCFSSDIHQLSLCEYMPVLPHIYDVLMMFEGAF